jgi:hypothetical protein
MSRRERFTVASVPLRVTEARAGTETRVSKIITCDVNLSANEIRSHVEAILQKLRTKNRAEKLRLYSL